MKKFYQLDTTRICNLRCSFCYKSGDEEKDVKDISGFMTLKDIKKIINKDTQASGVSLVNNGEFFLNPEWKEIVDHICLTQSKYSNLEVISLNTNATLLDSENSDLLINTIKKHRIHFNLIFSLNASTKKTYLKITGKDLYRNTVKNIEDFIKKVSSDPELKYLITISVQSVVFPDNLTDIRGFVERWSGFFNRLNLDYEIIEDNYTSKKAFLITLRRVLMKGVDANRIFSKIIKDLSEDYEIKLDERFLEQSRDYFKRKVCKYLFDYPAIKGDLVSICCRDTFMRHVYKKRGEPENDLERFFKLSHILGEFENIVLCRACENYESMPDKEINDYLECQENKKLSIGKYILKTLKEAELRSDDLKKYYENRLKTGFSYELYNMDGPQNSISRNIDIKTMTKEKEMDFCVAWTRYLYAEKGTLKAGCNKQIIIKDLKDYLNKIKEYDLSVVPDDCFFCEKKFSHEPVRDRKYTYPSGIRSPFMVNNALIPEINKYIKTLENEEFDKAIERLGEFKSNQLYREFMEHGRDSKRLCELVCSTEDEFLICEYAIFSENSENYMKAFKSLMSLKIRRIPFLKLVVKVLEKDPKLILEHKNILYKTLSYMQKNEDYRSVLENSLINLYSEDELNIPVIQKLFDDDLFTETLKYFLINSLSEKRIDLDKYFDFVESFLDSKVDYSAFLRTTAVDLLRENEFYSLLRFIRKYRDKIDQRLYNDLTSIDFEDYSVRYVHFLIALSLNKELSEDRIKHQIYSWYMKKERFSKAWIYFEMIENKKTFWDDETLKRTREFLENPSVSLRTKFFGIFKGK